LGMSVPLDFDFSLFQSPKGRLQTPHSSLESGISVQFQSPKGRLQTQKYGTVSATKKYCFNPQRGGYKLRNLKMSWILKYCFNPQRGGYKLHHELSTVPPCKPFQSPKGRLQTDYDYDLYGGWY